MPSSSTRPPPFKTVTYVLTSMQVHTIASYPTAFLNVSMLQCVIGLLGCVCGRGQVTEELYAYKSKNGSDSYFHLVTVAILWSMM